MPILLNEAERADIARIAHNSAARTIHETVAKHFIAVGLERAAARCDDFADATRHGGDPSVVKAFELAASAIRAIK